MIAQIAQFEKECRMSVATREHGRRFLLAQQALAAGTEWCAAFIRAVLHRQGQGALAIVASGNVQLMRQVIEANIGGYEDPADYVFCTDHAQVNGQALTHREIERYVRDHGDMRVYDHYAFDLLDYWQPDTWSRVNVAHRAYMGGGYYEKLANTISVMPFDPKVFITGTCPSTAGDSLWLMGQYLQTVTHYVFQAQRTTDVPHQVGAIVNAT